MNSAPTVCCVLLTSDRPEMTRRAIECFRGQSYPDKRLLVVNQSHDPIPVRKLLAGDEVILGNVTLIDVGTRPDVPPNGSAIGELRNYAAGFGAVYDSDITIHWDSDDYSHPRRIAEQVELLQSTGAGAVGYRECLFWREPIRRYDYPDEISFKTAEADSGARATDGEAWLYTNTDPSYCLGASLCYWRKTWERKPFEHTSQGEDFRFCSGLKTVGARGIADGVPRMVCRIHAGNTSNAYRDMNNCDEWRRVAEWDARCRGVM